MPYRLKPSDRRCVQVERSSGDWHTLKCHDSVQAARNHQKALQANVEHKDGRTGETKPRDV